MSPKSPFSRFAKAPRGGGRKNPVERGMPWLVKSEPDVYSFSDLQRDKKTVWDGVRNFTARNNLRAMKKDDEVLFYHSNEGKEVVGVAMVAKEAYPDPKDKDWAAVDLAPVKALKEPVSLATIKEKLPDMVFVRQGRLSVSPVSKEEFLQILKLGKTK